MVPQTSRLISHPIPSIIPLQPFQSISKPPHFTPSIKLKNPSSKSSHLPLRCSLSVAEAAPKQEQLGRRFKPSSAEVSRTIMELSTVGILSVLTDDGWPLGIGVQFMVDEQGGPVLCLNSSVQQLSTDQRSSLYVQLEQCGSRTPQCTLQGNLKKPEDRLTMKSQARKKAQVGMSGWQLVLLKITTTSLMDSENSRQLTPPRWEMAYDDDDDLLYH